MLGRQITYVEGTVEAVKSREGTCLGWEVRKDNILPETRILTVIRADVY